MHILLFLVSLSVLLPSFIHASQNLLFQEAENGEDVVLASIDEVGRMFKGSLDPIPVFLKRIARSESNFGKHPKTFREGYYGGIWQIDHIAFLETQRTNAHPSLRKLSRVFSQYMHSRFHRSENWQVFSWQVCLAPLFSCVGARLYLALVEERVPQLLLEQAYYWKKYYNTEKGAGSVAKFIKDNQDDERE